MHKNILFIGKDVHKDSIDIAIVKDITIKHVAIERSFMLILRGIDR